MHGILSIVCLIIFRFNDYSATIPFVFKHFSRLKRKKNKLKLHNLQFQIEIQYLPESWQHKLLLQLAVLYTYMYMYAYAYVFLFCFSKYG